MNDLLANLRPAAEEMKDGAFLLANFADTDKILQELPRLLEASPLRHMTTPGGRQMRVAMTNCGQYGWVSAPSGYRYDSTDPTTGNPWPDMPEPFMALAKNAAAAAGYDGFAPDVCLINRYGVGTRLSPHIDQDEAEKSWPIVSVSIGIPAIFQLFGSARGGTATNIPLYDGDVMVLGGRARMYYHGVKPVTAARDARIGALRYNLTFRRAR
ncbi:DNA oxidative demethylase AlkB [Kordiimonas aestuarii]|uniref:DNA oxidative demethylase AlkB n=1 Tax=Kordiimonas aestuarii TaxID=1005925 RepID=UPI0021CE3486|nr:DNA oxidative demethylase AlkB [Kordiimonas aestuarii]